MVSASLVRQQVERGKRELKVKLFGGSGSSSEVCSEVGQHMLAYGRGIPAAEMILRINAVDAEEVKWGRESAPGKWGRPRRGPIS